MNSQYISAEDFLTQYSDASPTVIDLRTAAEYGRECLASSILMPVQELTSDSLQAQLEKLDDQAGPIYLLCQSGARAKTAVSKLGDCGHELVTIDGGLNALKAAGAPIQTGSSKVISLERQVRIAAGFLTLLGVVLGLVLTPAFLALSAFVGCGLMFAGITDHCGMAMILTRMPWNRATS